MSLKNEFEENGYVILKGVFDEETLQKRRALVENIVAYAEKKLEDPFSDYYMPHREDQGALMDLFQRHPEFQEMARNEIILDALEEFIGKDIFMYENSLVYKPKSKRNEVPWHQDFINRPDEPVKPIVWIALDNVTKENGAMTVIPGSHKNGFLPWYTVKGETHHTRVKPEFVDEDKAVFVEMNAGDVLIFNQLVLHGSERISSDAPRRAYRISYQGFDQIKTPRATPIVLRGGNPQSLEKKFTRKQADLPKKPFVKRALNAIGKRLQNI